jgi:hypothetical protein
MARVLANFLVRSTGQITWGLWLAWTSLGGLTAIFRETVSGLIWSQDTMLLSMAELTAYLLVERTPTFWDHRMLCTVSILEETELVLFFF